MPIYGYQCQVCGHDFELMQKMSDPDPSTCPACGKPDVRKQLSAAGFHLKGSGWYATDFKGGDKKSADKKPADKDSSSTKDSSDSGPKSGGCGGGTCGSCA
jgi:putative FmdB family regulatory protein